jgi:hypothetical protein
MKIHILSNQRLSIELITVVFTTNFIFGPQNIKKKNFFSNSIKNFFWGGEATHRIIRLVA